MQSELRKKYRQGVREMKLFFENVIWPPKVEGRKITLTSNRGNIPDELLCLISLVKGDGTFVQKRVQKTGQEIVLTIDNKENPSHVRLAGPWLKESIDDRVIPTYLKSL